MPKGRGGHGRAMRASSANNSGPAVFSWSQISKHRGRPSSLSRAAGLGHVDWASIAVSGTVLSPLPRWFRSGILGTLPLSVVVGGIRIVSLVSQPESPESEGRFSAEPSRPGGRRPDGPRAVARRSVLVSDQRCKERERGEAAQHTNGITEVQNCQAL